MNHQETATPIPVITEEQSERIEEMQRDLEIEFERDSHVQEDD
jgi:hypothetical protein